MTAPTRRIHGGYTKPELLAHLTPRPSAASEDECEVAA